MEKKDIIKRYGAHYDAIQIIGGYPLSQYLQLSDLGDTKEMKADIQRCYKETKDDGMLIAITDYLCWISSLYLVDTILKIVPKEKFADYLIANYGSFKADANNFLRLLNKRPELLKLEREDFKKLMVFWLEKYMEGLTKDNK
jgi:hypothetical protein